MKCRKIQNWLTNHSEIESNNKIKNHLLICENCRRFQKNLPFLRTELKSITHPSPSNRLSEQTRNQCKTILRSISGEKSINVVSGPSLPIGFRIFSLVSVVLTVIWISVSLDQYGLDQSLSFESAVAFRLLLQNGLMLLLSPLLIHQIQLRKIRMYKISIAKMNS